MTEWVNDEWVNVLEPLIVPQSSNFGVKLILESANSDSFRDTTTVYK